LPLIILFKQFNTSYLFTENDHNDYREPLKYLFIVATLVYIVRWAILPDEIEYLINYFLILFIFAVVFFNYKFLILVFLSIYSQYFFVPYFVEKDIRFLNNGIENNYSFNLGIAKGILEQSNIIRNSNQEIVQKEFIDKLKFIPPLRTNLSTIEYPPYLNALILNKQNIITGPIGLSQIFKHPRDMFRTKHIYLCSTNIIPNRGWRSFQKTKSIDRSEPILCKRI